MPEDVPANASLHSIGDYYSAAQLRSDRWSSLRGTMDRLGHLRPGDPEAAKLAKHAEELFEALSPIEMYWAFPGLAAFDHMRRQLEHRNWEDLAFSVRRVVRALTSGTYRRRTITLAREDSDAEDIEDEATLPIEARALARPYFEVLLVDDLGEHQERWLRTSLARMRRSEDAFLYEPVVVSSLEDALIAILFNHNIQAVVVRPGLTLKSRNTLSILTNYLNRIGDEDLEAVAPEEYGPELCRLITARSRISPGATSAAVAGCSTTRKISSNCT
jgi:arginine decarboxylase